MRPAPDEPAPPAGTYVDQNGVFLTVLYLRPGGRFLLRGVWHGYESSEAHGRWEWVGAQVKLEGGGQVVGCCPDQWAKHLGRRFRQAFRVIREEGRLALLADAAAADWGTLGRRGPFQYIGEAPYAARARGAALPGSMAEVDARIALLLDNRS